jgi:outer membrane biogenesis lipoprotein LolB
LIGVRPARLFSALVLAALLAGCTHLRPATEDDSSPGGLEHFSVDGKVSWRGAGRSGRASVSWTQDSTRGRLVLSGPFGTGAAVLEAGAGSARLQIGDDVRVARDAASLLESELGLPLPVAEARHWVVGATRRGACSSSNRPAGEWSSIAIDRWTASPCQVAWKCGARG